MNHFKQFPNIYFVVRLLIILSMEDLEEENAVDPLAPSPDPPITSVGIYCF